MGLLDFNFDDPKTQGLLSAAAAMMQASGPSRMPISTGQIIGQGLQSGMQGYQQGDMLRRKKEEEDLARQFEQMKMQQYQQQIQQQEAARKKQAMLPQIVAQFGNDYQGMIRAGIPHDYVKSLAESRNYGRDEVARTQEVAGNNGQKLIRSTSKFGDVIGQDQNGYVAPQLVNRGDYQEMVTPMAGQTFKAGMSPADKATAFRANRSYEQSERHFNETQNKPVFNAELGGFVSPKGGFMPVQGVPQKGVKMTEDQAKATGWLVQAENAWANMQAAGTSGKDAQGNFIMKESASPGINDVIAGVPSFGFAGGVANVFRGSERQKFMQSASSLSEALLRAATGAGVNQDEAAQKVAELTPKIGDSEEVKQQKMAAVPLYIESLKVRSGAGASQAENIFKNNSTPPKADTSQIPKEAVNMLKMNPKLRDAFDQKYGAGASSRILGQ